MAYVTIKGRTDRIFLEEERAKKLKEAWMKALPGERVDLGGWAGDFSKIASIEIEGSRKDEYGEETKREYSDVELAIFDKEMQKYAEERTSWRGVRYTHFHTEKYLEEVSAITVTEQECTCTGEPHMVQHRAVVVIDGKSPLKIYNNKLDQWKRWRSRKEYGKAMRDADLDKMAAEIASSKRI